MSTVMFDDRCSMSCPMSRCFSDTPCTASVSYVPTTAGAVKVGGSLVSATVVGQLFLGCPIKTPGATVTVNLTSATPNVCSVGVGHTTLHNVNSVNSGSGVDVYVSDIATGPTGTTLQTNGGPCRFHVKTHSTQDTGVGSYEALASTSVAVVDISQASLVVSSTTLALSSGCSTTPGNY